MWLWARVRLRSPKNWGMCARACGTILELLRCVHLKGKYIATQCLIITLPKNDVFENGIRQNSILFDQCVCLLFCESGSAHTSVAISRQIPTRQKGECEFSAATKNFVKHQGWPQLWLSPAQDTASKGLKQPLCTVKKRLFLYKKLIWVSPKAPF